MIMTDAERARLLALVERVGNVVANLAHPEGDHCENLLEDEAHDLFRELRAALLPPEGQPNTVDAFVAWVKRTPHDSLFGDSRVAYDAQVRVLGQLQWYLEGKDDYLNACVALCPAEAPVGQESSYVDRKECGRCGHIAHWHAMLGDGDCQQPTGCSCHEFKVEQT